MRILNISAQKPDSTGSGTYLSALVRSQLAAGCEPAVLCGAAPGDTQGDIPTGVPVYTVDFDTPELPFHICGMSDVMPYPSTRYRDLTSQMTSSFEDGLERERVLAAVRGLDAVFSLHAEQAQQVVETYGVDPARVRVVGTGYDHHTFCPDASVPRRVDSLVFVGKVCVKKGVASLLEALGLVDRGSHPDLSLTLVGGHAHDDEFQQIESAAAASTVPVTIAGRVDGEELVRTYRASEVFVLPSFFEGLPLVTIEALACGCKVVMTELPGVRPWMEAALPGAPVAWVTPPTMVDVDTPDSRDLPRFERDLAQALQDALDAPAPCFDTSGVSWDACSERILETVQRLLEQKGGIDG